MLAQPLQIAEKKNVCFFLNDVSVQRCVREVGYHPWQQDDVRECAMELVNQYFLTYKGVFHKTDVTK